MVSFHWLNFHFFLFCFYFSFPPSTILSQLISILWTKDDRTEGKKLERKRIEHALRKNDYIQDFSFKNSLLINWVSNRFNPFSPVPSLTACVDPRPFYHLLRRQF